MLIEFKMYSTHALIGLTFNLFYQQKFNKEWDTTLNSWLDDVEEGRIEASLKKCGSSYTDFLVELTGEGFFKEIWTANKYYSYGHLSRIEKYGCLIPESQQHRPSIHTMIRLEKLVQKLEKEYKDSQKLTTEQLYK